MQRFEREAKLLASLNHPNIATVHGLEEVDGKRYLILEYVEGETLEERLRGGAIEVGEALPIAIQIAEAIEAAHEQGVIHRDLKPANIKFTTSEDEQVKVLDFGLAKTMDDQPSSISNMANSPTVVQESSPTLPGLILGTAGYLSPEQARGRPVDKRTDIFSFGCVVYEMLTGLPPFPGETATDSIGATLHKDVDFDRLPADTPPIVRHVLNRCLERDRKKRLRDIGDARIEITHAIADPSSLSLGLAATAVDELAENRLRRRLLAGLALVVVAGLAATFMWFATSSLRLTPPPPPTARLVIPSQTDAYQYASDMLVSPDGTRVAFVASRNTDTGASDEKLLWVRRLDEFDAQELGAEAAGGLFWSPDSRHIGFLADRKLWSIRADGSDKHMLASISDFGAATWSVDGAIIVSEGNQGLRILRAGAAAFDPLITMDTDAFKTRLLHPHFLPDGNRYLYLKVILDSEHEIHTRTLYAGNLTTGKQTLIGSFPSAPWYVEPGYLVYVEDGTVKAVSFDVNLLRIIGEPSIFAQGAHYFKPTGRASISASRNGVIVFTPVRAERGLIWFDADGNRLGQVGTRAIYGSDLRISPDGQTVALTASDPRTGQDDIILRSLQRDTSRRLTFDARWEGNPVWSSDGKTIFFSNNHHGQPDIYSLKVSGGATPQVIFRESGVWFPTDISPDGRFLAIHGSKTLTVYGIWMAPLDSEGEPFVFIQKRGNQLDPMFSPDGHLIAYVSSESGANEIFVDTFPDSIGGIQVSIHGGTSPVWSPDGKKLYFGQHPSDDREWAVMLVEFSNSDPPTPLPPQVVFKPGPFIGFDLAPDGERFLLRMLPAETQDNHVILNWVENMTSTQPENAR